MKKELLVHYGVFFVFLVIAILIQRWFYIGVWPFILGGIIGTALPNVDHLIYVYFLKPQELNSQRVTYLNNEKNYRKSLEILSETKYERSMAIFHSVFFQVVILVLTFYVVTSSSSLFASGIVIAFSLHLLVDQVMDIRRLSTIQSWFRNINIQMTRKNSIIYVAVMSFLLAVVVFVL